MFKKDLFNSSFNFVPFSHVPGGKSDVMMCVVSVYLATLAGSSQSANSSNPISGIQSSSEGPPSSCLTEQEEQSLLPLFVYVLLLKNVVLH